MITLKEIKDRIHHYPNVLRIKVLLGLLLILAFCIFAFCFGIVIKRLDIVTFSVIGIATLILGLLLNDVKKQKYSNIVYFETHSTGRKDLKRFLEGLKISGLVEKDVNLPEYTRPFSYLMVDETHDINELRNTNYHFDTEADEPKEMYKNLLNELAKISRKRFNPVQIKDSCKEFDTVSKLGFTLNKNRYETIVNTKGDWLDLSVIDFVNEVLGKEGVAEKFYVNVLAQDVAVYFLNNAQYEFLSWYMWLNSHSPFIRGFN